MNYLVKLWRQMFDIRAGEHVRTWAMFWYLFSVLMAYYIVKPVSRSMFLTKFDVDKLPSLYIVIAVAGGVFAYLYSRLAAKTSLHTADDVALRDLAMRDVGVHLRGLGGVLLLLLTGGMMHLGIRGLSLVVIAFCAVWALFSTMARNEYVASVHRR